MTYLKTIVKNSLYRFFDNSIHRNIYNSEINKRASLPFTAVEKLAAHINVFYPYSKELHQPNDFYGHAKMLKKFLGLSNSHQFKFVIEHGVVFSDYIGPLELEAKLPSIITLSPLRKRILEKVIPKAWSIGPYIHYAKPLLSPSELEEQKKSFGKVLLVFPSHSTLDTNTEFNIDYFCKEIKKNSKDFQTTLICLYWKDILLGKHLLYKKNGFVCVTAGHILDSNFLPRLKSIIEISDYTLSSDPGTHIGYCILMNKPHLLIPMTHKVTGNKKQSELALSFHKQDLYLHVIEEFSKKEKSISANQRQIVNKIWGVSQIKSKRELLNILAESERIYYGNK